MTREERIIVSGYTGIMMTSMAPLHAAVEARLGRQVWTHQFADSALWVEIRDSFRDDFLALCDDDSPTRWTHGDDSQEASS